MLPLLLLALAFAGSMGAAVAAGGDEPASVTVAFWNVENLFDTDDDPKCEGDNEFLPGNGWVEERYRRKLGHLAEAIAAMDPSLLGVAEVENRRVLEDLAAEPRLKAKGYRVAHRESFDKRGIDVALLYRAPFEVVDEKTDVAIHEIPMDPPTRGVFEARLRAGDATLVVLVNHWPSRIGGTDQTKPLRKKAAEVCRRIVKERVEAAKEGASPDLLLMGDLNDSPFDESVAGALGSTAEREAVLGSGPDAKTSLWNPMFRFLGDGSNRGTLYYRGKGSVFDQFAVSRGLLEDPGFRLDESSVEIFATDAMKDGEGHPKRFRRGQGGQWTEGYSDHFPIRAKLRLAAAPK